MSIIDWMKTIDPNYGNEEHQRDYVDHMEELQRTHPCTKSHEGDTPPTHAPKCYPDGAMQRIITARLRRRREVGP